MTKFEELMFTLWIAITVWMIAGLLVEDAPKPIHHVSHHNHWNDGWHPSWQMMPTTYDTKVEQYCQEYLAERYKNQKKTPQVKGRWMGELSKCLKRLGYLDGLRLEASFDASSDPRSALQ